MGRNFGGNLQVSWTLPNISRFPGRNYISSQPGFWMRTNETWTSMRQRSGNCPRPLRTLRAAMSPSNIF